MIARAVWMQFGCQLCAGGACPDDCNVKLAWTDGGVLALRAHAGVKQTAVEAACLFGGLQRHCKLLGARSSKIMAASISREETTSKNKRSIYLDHWGQRCLDFRGLV